MLKRFQQMKILRDSCKFIESNILMNLNFNTCYLLNLYCYLNLGPGWLNFGHRQPPLKKKRNEILVWSI